MESITTESNLNEDDYKEDEESDNDLGEEDDEATEEEGGREQDCLVDDVYTNINNKLPDEILVLCFKKLIKHSEFLLISVAVLRRICRKWNRVILDNFDMAHHLPQEIHIPK